MCFAMTAPQSISPAAATALVDKIANIVSDYYDEDDAGRWLKCARHIADSLTDEAATPPHSAGIEQALRELLRCPTIHETWRKPAVAALAVAQSEREPALVEFFKWAMREGPWEGGDLDGGSIQDKAESLGLIVRTKFDPEKHGTAYGDFSEGDDYYEFAPGVSLPSTERQP
jgi:hypothetical protein